jgi:hypothetical protein
MAQAQAQAQAQQKEVFFTQENEGVIQGVVYKEVCKRIGGDLNERQATRLVKTVKHYMAEVYRIKGSREGKVALNKEVIAASLPDYMSYLNRSAAAGRSAVADIETGTETVQTVSGLITDKETVTIEKRSQMDITTAFSELQTSRMPAAQPRRSPQDFRISLQDEPPLSMDRFQQMKEEREAQALAAAMASQRALSGPASSGQGPASSGLGMQGPASSGQGQGQADFASATDSWAQGKRRADEEAEAAFAARERQRMEARATADPLFQPQPLPDMRALILGDRQTLDRTRPVPGQPQAAGNPTLALATAQRQPTGGLQQMIITREPETMAYKEREYTFFVYSADRDWVNSAETRYNFSVNFDSSTAPLSSRLNTSSSMKFRNITRIEFVKAILPGESLDTLVTKASATTYDTSLNTNVLSFPYIQLQIPELDTDIHGTNESMDAVFSVLQYDANWISDSGNSQTRGYFAMIPKFLKSQKVYHPTPLATLQKLSFQFQRPDGTPLSSVSDTLDISQVIPTLAMTAGNFTAGSALTNTVYQKDATVETVGSAYYWLKTTSYFNHWTVSKGDRIVMRNMTWATAPTGSAVVQLNDFTTTMQATGGLLVVDTGVITGTGPVGYVFSTGYNSQGYANAILVRGRFTDPTTGVFLPAAPGGVNDAYTSGLLSYYLVNTALTSGRLMNLSHQVQVCLRVIVREMDSMGLLRPDNL